MRIRREPTSREFQSQKPVYKKVQTCYLPKNVNGMHYPHLPTYQEIDKAINVISCTRFSAEVPSRSPVEPGFQLGMGVIAPVPRV